METTQELALFIAEAMSEKQATDIVILNVGETVGYTEFFIIGTARSGRQVQAIVGHLERRVRDVSEQRPLSREGVNEGNWALLDFGDVVVHIFKGEERLFYDLDGLWSEAPKVPFEPSEVPSAPLA